MSEEQGDKTSKADVSSSKKGRQSVEKTSMGGKGGRVIFKDKIEIFPDKPLSKYNFGPNKAYSAVEKTKGGGGIIAIVCERNLVPRLSLTHKYAQFNNPNLCVLVGSGVVYWPPASQERYVFFYEDNWGDPLLQMETPTSPMAMGWKPDVVMDKIVHPMVNIFLDFQDRDFVHGSIRPDNMFGVSGGALKNLVLGDCLCTPSSYLQPALYEPIDRAMADPIARGRGSRADDLYSFGVSLAVMMRVSDPLKGLDDRAVLRKKIELGTYAAITGKDRFKGDILELLRGVLHDDPSQRWSIPDMMSWLDGRRLSPKQSLVRHRAPRPLHFLDEKIFYIPTLAMALTNNSTETKRIIEDGSLVQWLQRAIDDEDAIDRVEKAVVGASENGAGPDQQERLVSHVSAALDQFAPLRFKGLSVLGGGVGAALVDAVVSKGDVQPFVGIFSSNVMAAWIGFHENTSIDLSWLYTRFEQCKRFIRSKKVGEGLERCLYVLSVESPCLSPVLEDYFVTDPEQLLVAFEGVCQKNQMSGMFIDRHVAAFLMEREVNLLETRIFDLNSGEESRIALANLRCLADIQKRHKVGPVPAVSKYLAAFVGVACELYHDRDMRKALKASIAKMAADGDLKKMVALLDDPSLLTGDKTGFDAAQAEYAALSEEAAELAVRLEDRKRFGIEAGRQWAAVISSMIAALVIVGMTLTLLLDLSLF